MRLKLAGFAAIGVAALILSGCASQCVTISSVGNNGKNVGEAFEGNVGVSMTSSQLAGTLVNGKVQFTNKTSDTQKFRYRFNWYTQTGFNQGQPTAWQPITLAPDMSRVVASVAPTQEATKFNVEVCQP